MSLIVTQMTKIGAQADIGIYIKTGGGFSFDRLVNKLLSRCFLYGFGFNSLLVFFTGGKQEGQ